MALHVITESLQLRSEIDVTPGLLTGSALAAGILGAAAVPERAVVFAQPGSTPVARTVVAALGATGIDTHLEVLPDGEAAKTFAVVEAACQLLNRLGFTRSDLVLGVGGGALTDVSGFIAATYLRGVDVVLVPTTLLAAVDAAIGGKTGVNVGGKNLAGAFRHPQRVLIDPDMLEQIPVALRRQGSAESLKAGLIADPELLALYETSGLDAPLAEVIDRAVAVKVAVVNSDFTEQGSRAWLNYGHTVGHAVEVAAGISHGEAVAIGMVAAGAASERLVGFTGAQRQRAAIAQLGLPTVAPDVDRTEILRLMALDKKRDRSGLRMTLLRRIGEPVVAPVDDATVDVALTAVGIT